MKKNDKNKYYNLMLKDLDNWKGIFYVNSKDPRMIVPKLNPYFGWTLNFGNVYSYIVIIAIIVFIISSQYFL